jgi:hypothetical protein
VNQSDQPAAWIRYPEPGRRQGHPAAPDINGHAIGELRLANRLYAVDDRVVMGHPVSARPPAAVRLHPGRPDLVPARRMSRHHGGSI